MHEQEIRETIRQMMADFDAATPEQREAEKARLVALYGANVPSAGPWEAHDDDGTGTLPCVLSEHVNPSGTFYVGQFNRYADAMLSAAAPELADILEAFLVPLSDLGIAETNPYGKIHFVREEARAALRKAGRLS